MDSPALPYELLFLVIENIDSSSVEGHRTLSAISLSNRSLRFACQDRMFKDVKISYLGPSFAQDMERSIDFWDGELTTGWKFRDLLFESPHIRPYVERLTITILPSLNRPQGHIASSTSATFSLYDIGHLLPNLKKFLTFQTGPFGWYSVSERMRAFFVTIASSVNELDLRPFRLVPADILSGCHNLRILHVSSVDIGEGTSAGNLVTKTKLRGLRIGFSSLDNEPTTTWISTPQSPLDISELLSITCYNSLTLTRGLNTLLAHCFGALKELSFYVDLYGEDIADETEPVVDLSGLLNLQCLTIRSNIRARDRLGEMETIAANFLSIAAVLKSLPFGKLQRQQLQFNLVLAVIYLEDFDRKLATLPPWSYVVDVLADDRSSSRISEANVKIRRIQRQNGPVHVNMTTAALTSILDKNEQLKDLRERGLLSYHVFLNV